MQGPPGCCSPASALPRSRAPGHPPIATHLHSVPTPVPIRCAHRALLPPPFPAAGLPEQAFIEELSVLAPQHARELLHILEAARLLRVTTLPPAVPASSSGGADGAPASVLSACFAAAPAGGSGDGGGAGQALEGGAGAGAGPASEDGEEDDSDGEGAGGQRQQRARCRPQKFYFVLPGACFNTPRVLPPQALLPQAGAAGD